MDDLKTVVAQGNRRKSLEVLRDHLAAQIQDADPRDVASLTRELRAVLADIEAIPHVREDSVADNLAAGVADELSKRRANRGKKAPGL